MLENKSILITYMSIALLFVQLSGLHLHVGVDSLDSSSHISKLHGLDDDEHDHGIETEVDLFEVNSSTYKLVHLFLLAVFIIVAVNLATRLYIPPPSNRTLYRRLDFWRPILRAPPISH